MGDAELDFDGVAEGRRGQPATAGGNRRWTRQAQTVKQGGQQDQAIPQEQDIGEARQVIAGYEPEEACAKQNQGARG